MPFLAVGVEHKTSPLAVRESVALERDAVAEAAAELQRHPAIVETAILSTCNRTEIYLFAGDPAEATAAAAAYLAALDHRLPPYIQTWEEMTAVEHLFRVACGLESQVLGEPQILSQVRETLENAQQNGTIGPNLHSLFRTAISCAKQARAGTALGTVNVSIGSEAVRAAAQDLGTLQDRAVLVIGGGEIGRLVVEELRARAAGTLFIINRTDSVAVDLARRYAGTPVRLADLPRALEQVELVISVTSAPHYLITPEAVPAARDRTLHIFDLAIPRDVDPAVGEMEGVVLRDLDTLLPSGLVDHWSEDIRAMESVIAAEIQEFTAWYLTRRVAPVIANLRSHVEAVLAQEQKRVAPRLADLTDRERDAVESLTQRLVDKMFHHLVTRLRLAAQTDPKLVDAAEFFFLHGDGGLFDHAAQLYSETGAVEAGAAAPEPPKPPR
ncbi:MAG TPA: glutamyl-tRNA reductase [Chloroflexota bacterium]|nr:glutamyl-tRNA reductase [Chloroflexota bacterium]